MELIILLVLYFIAPIVLWALPTSAPVKHLAVGMSVIFFLWTLVAALRANDVAQPCFLLQSCALYAFAGWRHWYYPNIRRFPPGHCQKCGYDLTGNISGACPECGESIPHDDVAEAD